MSQVVSRRLDEIDERAAVLAGGAGRDDAKDPHYIANVVRRGYRLIAPVSAWEGSGTASSTGAPVPVVVTDQWE